MLGMNFIPNYYAYFSFAWTFAIFVQFGFVKEQENLQEERDFLLTVF